MRTIKKYPNRRLYDMERSRYITLADVRTMVRDRVKFQVQDARTGEDITRSILLQVILEEEEDGARPLLTTEILTQIIRFYGDTLQGMASEFLHGSLSLFTEQRKLFETQLRTAMARTPFAAWSDATGQQLEVWQKMQEALLGLGDLTGPDAASGPARDEATGPEKAAGAAGPEPSARAAAGGTSRAVHDAAPEKVRAGARAKGSGRPRGQRGVKTGRAKARRAGPQPGAAHRGRARLSRPSRKPGRSREERP